MLLFEHDKVLMINDQTIFFISTSIKLHENLCCKCLIKLFHLLFNEIRLENHISIIYATPPQQTHSSHISMRHPQHAQTTHTAHTKHTRNTHTCRSTPINPSHQSQRHWPAPIPATRFYIWFFFLFFRYLFGINFIWLRSPNMRPNNTFDLFDRKRSLSMFLVMGPRRTRGVIIWIIRRITIVKKFKIFIRWCTFGRKWVVPKVLTHWLRAQSVWVCHQKHRVKKHFCAIGLGFFPNLNILENNNTVVNLKWKLTTVGLFFDNRFFFIKVSKVGKFWQ